MPISYRDDPDRDLILSTFSGFVSQQDLLDFIDSVHADEHFRTTANELIVTDNTTGTDMDANLLLLISQRSQELSLTTPDKKIALVPTTELDFGFARMYKSMAEKTLWQVEIFRVRDEALLWLQD